MKLSRILALPMLALMLGSCGAGNNADNEKSGCNHECGKAKSSAIETIMTRTSVRKYQAKPVEKEKVDAILKAAMAAPTACNSQPWQFVVIDDRKILDQLAENSNSHQPLKTATLAIVVCGDMEKALPEAAQPYWIEDCSAAMENLLLAAHALELGAVWLGVYPTKDRVDAISSQLGLPSTIVPLGIASIGYPDEAPQPKDKWKPENVHMNGWK